MSTEETGGINLHFTYDQALKKKLEAFFGMTAGNIISAISGVNIEKSLDKPVDLNVRAVSWYLNLYPTGKNLDILFGDKRYAIYSPTQEQREAYQLLTQAAIPVLEEVTSFRVAASGDFFVITNVPIEARLLSQLPLFDSTPTDSTDLGSLEILNEAGKLLASIQKATGKFPQLEGLNSLVFTPFKPTDFLQLTPPFSLEDNLTVEQIGERIKHDLSVQNTTRESLKQLNAFLSGLGVKHQNA